MPSAMDRARTVVVSGVPVHVLPDSRTADKLVIHFQSRRRSRGGDVAGITYPTTIEGVAFVTFDRREDAERVVEKERQVLTDDVFPEDYALTVFPFSDDVFLYVPTAKVDLSWFGGDQSSLIERLRSAHRSLRFQPLPRQKAAIIEGPFAGVQALRTDLSHKFQSLKTDSVKLAGVYLKPKASVGIADTTAKELTASGSLSRLQQRTCEAQTLLSKRKTERNDFSMPKASGSNVPKMFWDNDAEETLTKHRTNSLRRQVVGEEENARLLSSTPDPNLSPAEDVKWQKGISTAYVQSRNYSPSKYLTALSSWDVTKQTLSPKDQLNIWLDSSRN